MGVENLKGEKWKLIKGFPKYKISSYGRVLSLDFARSGEEKLLQPTKIERGYLQVCLANNGTKEKFLVHRLVAEAFLKNPENLPQINHKDGNLGDNSVGNLEWCEMKCNNVSGTPLSRSERKKRAKAIFKELDYEYTEEVVETAKVGSYILSFAPFSDASKCCGQCFLNIYKEGRKCLPCRNFERKDKKNGFWRFSSQMEFDAVERRIVSAKYRMKQKKKENRLLSIFQ